MALEDYTFQQLETARLKDVQFLFRAVFRKKVSLEYLAAKYDTSWCGVKHLCFLAYHAGKPVAFYGALPQEFRYEDQTFLAAHTCDSITLPAHQRKGLHKELALRTYALMKEYGIRFVYAFHSEATYYSCKKLGWKEGVRMRGFWVEAGGIPWGKAAKKLPLIQNWYNRKVGQYFSRHAAPQQQGPWISEHELEKKVLRVNYTPEFFRYKHFTHNAAFQFNSVRCWAKADAVLHVGHLSFSGSDQMEQALSELQTMARKLGLTRILFQTAPGSPLNKWLEQHYQGFDSWLVGYLDFDENIPFKDWEMRYGDLDTF